MPNGWPAWERFLNEVKTGAQKIAQQEAADFLDAATKDTQAFLNDLERDLETWTQQLASEQLSMAEFEFLVKGKKDLAQMIALTQAGLAAIRIDRIRNALIDLVIKAASKMI